MRGRPQQLGLPFVRRDPAIVREDNGIERPGEITGHRHDASSRVGSARWNTFERSTYFTNLMTPLSGSENRGRGPNLDRAGDIGDLRSIAEEAHTLTGDTVVRL